jgi:transcription elongation factor GreA
VARLAELGDFSENVEYQLAKGRLRWINDRILKLEREINDAEIIAPNKKTDTAQVGHTVTVECAGTTKTFQILGSSETRPEEGIISHTSPIGLALMGKRVGDVVKVKIGERQIEYKIKEIK